MKSGIFQDAVESSTKVFGRKSSVSVVFEGDSAHTDGDTVYLPALPSSADISVDQADVIRGYRDHEAMHVRCTDTSPEGLQRLSALNQAGDPHHSSILQYCEDARIEKAGVQEYKGMADTLTAVNTEGAKILLKQIEGRGPADQVIAALPKTLQFRIVLSNESRTPFGIHSDGAFEAIISHIKAANPELYKLASVCAKEMADLPTGYDGNTLNEALSKTYTAKSFELAESITKRYYQFIEDQEQTPPPPPQPPQPPENPPVNPRPPKKGSEVTDGPTVPVPQDEEGGPDEGETTNTNPGGKGGKGSNETEDDGEDDSETKNEDDPEDDEDGDDGDDPEWEEEGEPDTGELGEGGGKGAGGGPVEWKGNVDDIDDLNLYGKALSDVVNDVSDVKKQHDSPSMRTGLFNVFSRKLSAKIPAVKFFDGMRLNTLASRKGAVTKIRNRLEKEIGGKRAMIRRILELELQARSDRRWVGGFKAGKLQSVRLVDAIQGRETVYKKRQDGKDMDTLLYISIDGSSSMDGAPAALSAMLAFALAEALERTGCDIEIVIWGDTHHPNAANCTDQEMKDIIQRFSKAFTERRAKNLPPKYVSSGLLSRVVLKSKRQRTNDDEVILAIGEAGASLNTGTPSHTAIFYDLEDMAKEQYGRKVYLHITDGQANAPSEGHDPSALMKEAHSFARSTGTQIVGVGICGMRVSHMFPDYVEASGADAYEPVMQKLAKILAKEDRNAPRRAA